ncbi:MAG: beta-N-acetylhexosaminidase [Bacteroidales bacterium]|nr:beta-N-acetylhexosaminidase [Bacteroidales bacterium]
MKKRRLFSLIMALTVTLFATAAEKQDINLIPYPQELILTGGTFRASGAPVNCDSSLGEDAVKAVKRFASSLSFDCVKPSSFATPYGLAATAAKGAVKGFAFIKDSSLKEGAYGIDITRRAVVVRASGFNGILYAIQTINQLLPKEIYKKVEAPKADWTIPCMSIKDEPRFAWRGILLDSGRHFWSIEEVKKILDAMEIYKMNRFHWHLTEDQGWRIEIKKYPRLTEVGAYRRGTMIGRDFKSCDNIRYGGYYTQDQLREVVAYAAERGITIVPEIDIPGHMLAALAAYPEIGCTGGPYEVWTRWGVSPQVICPGKEVTFEFLENVFTELTEIFPGEYIHIGGDECPKTEWEQSAECQAKIAELGLVTDEKATAEQRLQNYVTKRIQDFLATKGRKVIGWDEILEGDLAPGATVMSWRGTKGGIEAAGKGFDVIMTPNEFCYYNYAQSEDLDNEPLAQNRSPKSSITLEKAYGYDPLDGIPDGAQDRVLGVQANMWTEYIAEPEHLEYMFFPRLLAMSEVQWCRPSVKDYDRFKASALGRHIEILDFLGYNHK